MDVSSRGRNKYDTPPFRAQGVRIPKHVVLFAFCGGLVIQATVKFRNMMCHIALRMPAERIFLYGR